jgi:hypothetical protein
MRYVSKIQKFNNLSKTGSLVKIFQQKPTKIIILVKKVVKNRRFWVIFSTNKGTFLSARRGSRSSMVDIVGAHEYIKSRREFCAHRPLCALWANPKFVWGKNYFVEFLIFLNVILSFFAFYDIFCCFQQFSYLHYGPK